MGGVSLDATMTPPLFLRAGWRRIATLILAAAFVLGPAGALGTCVYADPLARCGEDCPCEAPDPSGCEDAEGCASPCGSASMPDSQPERGDDESRGCPSGCQQCRCCPGAVAATLALTAELSLVNTSVRLEMSEELPAGVRSADVFHPPRHTD